MNFIVIEGLDGAGKSTQIELLSKYFKSKNKSVEYLHFPTYNSEIFGGLISDFLSGKFGELSCVNPYLVALLFAGDRFNMSQKIQKHLDEGTNVIADRYVYSNIAFQGAKLNSKKEQAEICEWIFKMEYEYFKIPKPDLNIFLNVPLEFTKKTLEKRREKNDREYLKGNQDIHEANIEFQAKVLKMYKLAIQKYPDFKKIDCYDANNKIFTPEKISEKIIKLICKLK